MTKAPPFMKQRGADRNAAMKGDIQQPSRGAAAAKKPKSETVSGQFRLPKSKKTRK